MHTRNVALLLTCLVASTVTRALAEDRETGLSFATRSEVIARHAMAATSQPLATQVALQIMRDGGSAVDAAIAANAALGLMEPTSCGVGGDLFAIVWDAKTQQLYGLNASGRSPRGLTLDEFHKRNLTSVPKYGPLPVSVPGCVDGWFELHKRFGRLPMTQVLAPAIAYAREGFPVSEVIAFHWGRGAAAFKDYAGFQTTFLPDGRAPGRANCSAIRPWPRRSRRSPSRDAMRSTKETSRDASMSSCSGSRGFCATRIWPRTHPSGWTRCRPTIAATRFGSCRPMAKASRPCRSSTFSSGYDLKQARIRECRASALLPGSQETGLRRSSAVLCRPGVLQGSPGRVDLAGVCGGAAQTDRPRARRAAL